MRAAAPSGAAAGAVTKELDGAAPSAQRIMERCEVLAGVTEMEGGLTRVFLSPEHARASEITLQWMREAGMSARVDEIGNCVGRYDGDRPGLPCLMLGSHLDTVRDAGKYDGMLGVITAIECVHSLNRRGKRLPFAVEVIGFADEEGVRFNATLIGSRAVAGTLKRETLDVRDRNGVAMQDALANFGLDAAAIAKAARRRDEVLAYAELHIEQGPVLEREDLAVGVVTAINGATRFAVEICGLAGHAGTVPMDGRQDALAAAAECVLAVERRGASVAELVATVGKLECMPGAVNVIPGRVHISIDVRSPRDTERTAAVADIERALQDICKRRNVRLAIAKTHENGVSPCAPWVTDQLAGAIAAEGLPVRKLPSGAGHDGMAMIDLTDIGMLFVRCKGGVSHNPSEAVRLEDVETGARVFMRFIENFEAAA